MVSVYGEYLVNTGVIDCTHNVEVIPLSIQISMCYDIQHLYNSF